MHDVAIVRIVTERVFYDFAKSFGEKALIQLGNGLMYIFFGSGDAALHVSLIHADKVKYSMGIRERLGEKLILYK
jgi:hypothetical protein